jgi:hypothetical protein
MMEKRNIGMIKYWEEMILTPLLSTHYSIVRIVVGILSLYNDP